MVVRNKVYGVVEKYRSLLFKKATNKQLMKGYKSKSRILDFYLKNNRWPSRLSTNKREKQLGVRFENFVSKEAPSYDSNFRRLAMATGRNTNNKRKHNVRGFKKEILEFVKTNGRVPSTSYKYGNSEGEARLRHKLDYYTLDKNDMTFLGKVYEGDKCHRSGIPAKYRALINESLNVDRPLIRLVTNE